MLPLWIVQKLDIRLGQLQISRCKCRYLKKVDDALCLTDKQTGGGPVTILAHSAGGWLGRVYLLGFGHQDRIQKFISLGSPHLPPSKVRVYHKSLEVFAQMDFIAEYVTHPSMTRFQTFLYDWKLLDIARIGQDILSLSLK